MIWSEWGQQQGWEGCGWKQIVHFRCTLGYNKTCQLFSDNIILEMVVDYSNIFNLELTIQLM